MQRQSHGAYWWAARAAALGVCFSILAPTVRSQDGPQMLRMATVKVKLGMNAEYEAAQKEVSDALKKAGVPWRQVWTTTTFGDVGTYVSVTPISKFAEFDQIPPAVKAMGETKYQQYLARVGRCLDSVNYRALIYRPDLSLMSDRQTPVAMALVVTLVVTPGKEAAYEAIIKSDIVPALKKAGVKDAWVHRTLFGGSQSEYTVVVLYEKFAEVDAGSPLARGLGAEGMAALTAKTQGMIQSTNYVFARHIAELSFR